MLEHFSINRFRFYFLEKTELQCNAVEHIQKRAIRVIYSDIDGDYEIALIVAGMNSLKDRREMLMARFFKRQVLARNALLHYLLPERRDNDTIRSLRNSQPFPSIRAHTNKFHKSFRPYCLRTLLHSQLNNCIFLLTIAL